MDQDTPLKFHSSFHELLDTFRRVIVGMVWSQASVKDAKKFFETFPYVIHLPCSVDSRVIKIDKTILDLIEVEGFNQATPLFSKTLINFYRIFTIAVKDIIWGEADFSDLLSLPELQFLRHLRNASAHNNQFFWGRGRNRQIPTSIMWRNKEIRKELEGKQLYMDFMKPGDIFILLLDISKLVTNN